MFRLNRGHHVVAVVVVDFELIAVVVDAVAAGVVSVNSVAVRR